MLININCILSFKVLNVFCFLSEKWSPIGNGVAPCSFIPTAGKPGPLKFVSATPCYITVPKPTPTVMIHTELGTSWLSWIITTI